MENKENIWQKDYSNLTQEEKQYVSEWCENAEDYEQIRHFMMNMSQVNTTEVKPSEKVKADLLNQFPAKKQRSKGFWLNYFPFLFTSEGHMNWKPVAAIAVMTGIIFTVVFLNDPLSGSQENQLAENTVKEEKKEQSERPEFDSGKDKTTTVTDQKESESSEQNIVTEQEAPLEEVDENNQQILDKEFEKRSEEPTFFDETVQEQEQLVEDRFKDQPESSFDTRADDSESTLEGAQQPAPSAPREKATTVQSKDRLAKKKESAVLEEAEEESDRKAFSGIFGNKKRAKSDGYTSSAESQATPSADKELKLTTGESKTKNNNEDIHSLLFATY